MRSIPRCSIWFSGVTARGVHPCRRPNTLYSRRSELQTKTEMLVWGRGSLTRPAERSSGGFFFELHSNSPAARSSVRTAESGCTTQPLLLRRGISCIDIGEGDRQRHVGIFLT